MVYQCSKTITASAREGDFPEKFKFWKTNKFNSSNTLLFVQAIAITILSGAYVVIPGINKVFVIITNSGTMIYCLAYTLMALGFIAMRRKSPDTEHPFRVGKRKWSWILLCWFTDGNYRVCFNVNLYE